MEKLFELPEMLTLSGEIFDGSLNNRSGGDNGDGCSTGCSNGCNSGCGYGSGSGA